MLLLCIIGGWVPWPGQKQCCLLDFWSLEWSYLRYTSLCSKASLESKEGSSWSFLWLDPDLLLPALNFYSFTTFSMMSFDCSSLVCGPCLFLPFHPPLKVPVLQTSMNRNCWIGWNASWHCYPFALVMCSEVQPIIATWIPFPPPCLVFLLKNTHILPLHPYWNNFLKNPHLFFPTWT